MNGRYLLNRPKGKLMGVCAGAADWLGIDVLIVRLALIVAVLLYILTGWLAADDR
jgi:phage shock protein C